MILMSIINIYHINKDGVDKAIGYCLTFSSGREAAVETAPVYSSEL